jgi:exopolysaccharide production protein ExoZ
VERRRTFFGLIDQLRGVGALLVVYSHLVANFLASRHREWVVDRGVNVFVHNPLHAELNFGWPGVALFFFVSGFVVTQSAERESSGEYVLKRLLRIYPPLIVTVLLVAVMAHSGTLVTGLSGVPSAVQVLLGASLANYLVLAQPLLVVVGWTLVIEMFFYLALWATRPVLIRIPGAVPVVLLLAVTAIVAVHDRLGTTFALAAAFVAFVPLLVLGQIVYLVVQDRIVPWVGGLLGCAAWMAFVYGMRQTSPLFYDPKASFMANSALAFCVFVIAVLLEGRIKPSRPLAAVARRSYSLYLLHVPVGFTLLAALVDQAHLAYPLALAIELAFRFVERPSIRLGRRLTARGHRPAAPAPQPAPAGRA